jgi:TetR/AcrR family transcriptional regulator, regulator of autoinduction and epiphytic fitness
MPSRASMPHSPARAALRSLEGGRGDATRSDRGRRSPRPALVAVTERSRPGTGRMRKGESPRERGERTRARIAQAVIELLVKSELPPTAKEVASAAGVSVRLVFHHFEDMDALYRAVARTQVDRHWRTLGPVPRGLPIEQRIDRTVRQRAKLFDSISPVRRKAASLAVRHQDIADGLALTNTMLRSWLEETFADELGAAGRGRRELLAGLEAASSWETWERLRAVQGLPTATARRVVARTLRALLQA